MAVENMSFHPFLKAQIMKGLNLGTCLEANIYMGYCLTQEG